MKQAVITGASKGLGRAFAQELVHIGYEVLLIARSENLLQELKRELGQYPKSKIYILAVDLSDPSAVKKISEWCYHASFFPSVLINNAGYTCWGYFEDMPIAKQIDLLQLIIHATVALTHELLPAMKQQKEAYILNVCSTSAYQAIPTMSVYSASKAFIRIFSRALRYELKNSSVSVTCFSPGPMTTHFIEAAGMQALEQTSKKFEMDPREVARTGIKGMLKRKTEVIPGWTNRISVALTKIVPDFILEKIAANIYISKLK